MVLDTSDWTEEERKDWNLLRQLKNQLAYFDYERLSLTCLTGLKSEAHHRIAQIEGVWAKRAEEREKKYVSRVE